MAKKRRTSRKPGRKEALAVIILAMLVGLARQMLAPSYDLSNIPDYDGTSAYAVIDRNQPSFTEDEYTPESSEYYSELDSLGRCGVAEACVGVDLMPTEERESISKVKPTGWVQHQYDFVDGGSLYNRCHLIGFQLTGENANEKNLITGTRYMNTQGMLPFENKVADYVKATGNHVLYRVTPVFEGSDLVAQGVQMEAYSVEDQGEGVCFNVFCYNAQPGVGIEYASGESWSDPTVGTGSDSVTTSSGSDTLETYVLNTNSHKFHKPDCSGAARISAQNKQEVTTSRSELIDQGYSPCGTCNP